MDGQSVISPEVVARYAADAAREVEGVTAVVEGVRKGIRVDGDAIVTPCPLCHLSLDAWQSKLEAQTGRTFRLPILHLSQLIGVAAGFQESELKFKRHVVSVGPVLEKLQA